ncbi:hypothetical protein [Hydrogenophaga flava]|uniref:hypothetical protein n=1 Tax=Hydrogenophaga flava TaxID=65657 RepID=UPI000824B971|nr:hypothetical protein [Hydrogenophaga flava]
MTPLARCLSLLLAGLALAGCRESEAPLVAHSSTAQHNEYRNDLAVCGLNTHPIVPITTTVRYAEATVMAGFRSDYFPGAQPFPCNRLMAYRSQGVMLFRGTVPAGAALNTVNALLEISSFAPTAPIRVTEARPLSTGSTGTYSGATRESCRFRVASYPRTSYVPGPTNYGGPWITTTELADTGTHRFWVPLREPQMVNVTEEFRRSVIGGSDVVMRLVIEPDDIAFASAASNNCYGQFTVRLRIFAPDE